MDLCARAVELVLERGARQHRERARDVVCRAREHRAHGLVQLEAESAEPRATGRECGLGHRRNRAREHDRAAHFGRGQLRGGCDRVRHHAFERALAKLADQEACQEALLTARRNAEDLRERRLPACGAARALDRLQRVEPLARGRNRERSVAGGRETAELVHGSRAEPKRASDKEAGEPCDAGDPLVRPELAKRRAQQPHLLRAAASSRDGVRDGSERLQLHRAVSLRLRAPSFSR